MNRNESMIEANMSMRMTYIRARMAELGVFNLNRNMRDVWEAAFRRQMAVARMTARMGGDNVDTAREMWNGLRDVPNTAEGLIALVTEMAEGASHVTVEGPL